MGRTNKEELRLARRGELWGIFIGINEWDDPSWNPLPYCANDAEELAELFADPRRGGCSASNIRLLSTKSKERSAQPTRNNIIAAISYLADVAEDGDVILFGYFGHGLEHDKQSYILPTDGLRTRLHDTAIALSWVQETLRGSKAQVKVLFFDACHSGSLRGRAGNNAMSPAFAEMLLDELSRSEGWAVLSACKQDEHSYDLDEKKHGSFTYHLLEGLNGAADLNNDGVISVFEASQYAIVRTKRWAFENGLRQTPELKWNVTGDVVLVDRQAARPNLAASIPIVAIMGVKGGAGKSTIIGAMSELIASTGANVMVIDADLETGGLTKYLGARARRQPHVWTLLDAAYAKQHSQVPEGARDFGLWDVTPSYLREQRFGRIHLVPGRLSSDTRVGYNSLANIQPEARRNQAAVEILHEAMLRATNFEGKIDCILIDSGAEQNPLVSAGFALARYGFIVSSPNPEFRSEISYLETMHRERYPDHQFNAMNIIVNQATQETPRLWQGIPKTHFVREDTTIRHAAAQGAYDFEGIGLNSLYLDIQRVLQTCFDAQDQRLLPDEGKVWVKPFIEAMRGFPEVLLARPGFRFLHAMTAVFALLGLLIFSSAGWSFLQTRRAVSETISERAIMQPTAETKDQFQHKINSFKIPAELAERVWQLDNKIKIKGTISRNETQRIKEVNNYEPIKDAIVEAALIADAKSTELAQQKAGLQQVFTMSMFLGGLLIIYSVIYYRNHIGRRRLLQTLIVQRDAKDPEELGRFIRILLGTEDGKPQLRWLREQFRMYRPTLSNYI